MSNVASSSRPLCHVVIPCAGSGSRAGGQGPKQYQMLAGEPMVMHTLRAFAAVTDLARVVLVTAPHDASMPALLAALGDGRFETVAIGGATRADSVLAGLQHLGATGADDADWVLVHDAARCLITTEQIDRLIDTCAGDSVGGLLAHKLPDTLKTSIDGPGGVRVSSTVDRSDKWLAQTPQMFRIGALAAAIAHIGPAVTDEASAMEAMGLHPRLVPGGAQNFKVTYPEDFALAEAVLAQRAHGTTLERFGGVRGQAAGATVSRKTIF